MTNRFFISLLALFAVAACNADTAENAEPAAAAPRPDFRAALDDHIAAVQGRDLEAFEATLTSGEDLYVIFPGGAALETKDAILDFHREWFSDKDWIWDIQVEKIIEGEDMATAVTRYAYRDNAEGAPRLAWLVLVFKLEDGEWRLVHDQNTRIDTQGEG